MNIFMIRASHSTYYTWSERGQHRGSSGGDKDKDKDAHKDKYEDKDKYLQEESLPYLSYLILSHIYRKGSVHISSTLDARRTNL